MTERVVVREPTTTVQVVEATTVIVTEPAERVVVRERAVERVVVTEPTTVVRISEAPGPRGIPGPDRLFIGPAAPVTDLTEWMWVQTGLGPDGTGFTIWLEDGLP